MEYISSQRLGRLILMKYLKALSRDSRISSISGVSKINHIEDAIAKMFKL